MSTALRTSLIWHDEVMADVVHETPTPITLGTSGDATFTTSALALPPDFAIVTPGRRGYVLTLSAQMSGTICLGGVEHDVAAFVAAGDDPTGFRGVTLGGSDWGVIALDARGEHKLFFQFVPHEVEDWNLGHPMILAGLAGYAASIAALTAIWWSQGVGLGEAAFRGASLASLAIGLAAIVRWLFKQDTESRASLGFSVLLHAAILFLTFHIYDKVKSDDWPTAKSLTGPYEVEASEQRTTPERVVAIKAAPTVAPGVATPAPPMHVDAPPPTPPVKPWRPTIPRPRKTDRQPAPDTDGGGTPKVGLFTASDVLNKVKNGRGLETALTQLPDGGTRPDETPAAPGMSTRSGTGPDEDGDGDGGTGPGHNGGRRGGGTVGRATQTKGPIDTGPVRESVCIGCAGSGGGGPTTIIPIGGGDGSDDVLSKEEILHVMKKAAKKFQICYQKALDHNAGASGDLVMRFIIGPDGRVKEVRRASGSVDAAVSACVGRTIAILPFPAHQTGANVNFPFSFTRL